MPRVSSRRDRHGVETKIVGEYAHPTNYNNTDVPTAPLRAWFYEMIKTYRPMNGPLGVSDDDVDGPKVTDYRVGQSVIYAGFAWSVAQEAYQHTSEAAAKHGVGFFDVSATDGDIWIPSGGGTLSKRAR